MRKMWVLCLAVFVVGLIGCAENPTEPNREAALEPSPLAVPADIRELLELHTDIGALTPGEIPESTTPVPDPADSDYDIYAVTFLWGYLAGVPASSIALTDWSGSLSANAEVLIDPRFTIDFDAGQDSLLPVSTPDHVEWVSSTGFDIDGISFRVSLRRGNAYFAPPVLVFETAPITLRLPFQELDHFLAFYPVGNGQGVAVLARRIWDGACPSGALRGEWIRSDSSSDQGLFGGVWLDNDGTPSGIYSGEFWTNDDGTREFFGWVSGYVTDQVIAEMRGRWRYTDPRLCLTCGDDQGLFYGKVKWLDESGVGVVRGHFGDLTSAADRAALPMIGVWKKICNTDHVSSTASTSD